MGVQEKLSLQPRCQPPYGSAADELPGGESHNIVAGLCVVCVCCRVWCVRRLVFRRSSRMQHQARRATLFEASSSCYYAGGFGTAKKCWGPHCTPIVATFYTELHRFLRSMRKALCTMGSNESGMVGNQSSSLLRYFSENFECRLKEMKLSFRIRFRLNSSEFKLIAPDCVVESTFSLKIV